MYDLLTPAQILAYIDDIIATLDQDEDRFYVVLEILNQAKDEYLNVTEQDGA